ncbi:TCP-1/cpn60 chaperonin family protein [Haloarcula litorea]|uniref:TCP-1/cpn60 chaperonin family protein n=1 Tax=Haloarcula litorea TaxID=3032579 RepID=UPI0023E775EE|nr:TCP-1/cpn60 chaperonin family protein [Halomicroarcula sp. GDY20]
MTVGDLQEPEDERDEISFPEANIAGIRHITGTVQSTLGPTPRDKLLVSTGDDTSVVSDAPDYEVTSDGATILELLPLEHPIAEIARDIAGPRRPGETDIDGEDIPDGVTTTLVFANALLREAQALLDKGLHPRTVTRGYDKARTCAREAVDDLRRSVSEYSGDGLHACARTSITGNDIGGKADTWARFAVDAVRTVGAPDERTLAVRQTSDGAIDDSRLVKGAVLDANSVVDFRMPRSVEEATVLAIGGYERGGLRDPEIGDRYVATPESAADVDAFRDLFGDNRAEIISEIRSTGADVVVTRLGITPEYQAMLADLGIVGIRNVSRLDLRQVCAATGASLVKDPEDFATADLGHAGHVTEQTVGSRRDETGSSEMVLFEGCDDPDAVAVLLRGVTDRWGELATTQIRKAANAAAIAAGETTLPAGVVPGGGATHMAVSRRIGSRSAGEKSRERLALTAFTNALTRVVGTLASNCGLNPIDTVTTLRQRHTGGETTTGIAAPPGRIDDVWQQGVLDPAGLREQQYHKATEVANLVLRIDDSLDATFSEVPDSPDDSIHPAAAERHEDYRAENETRWD